MTLDDVERHGEGLVMGDILGVIIRLVEVRDCKVVVIFQREGNRLRRPC